MLEKLELPAPDLDLLTDLFSHDDRDRSAPDLRLLTDQDAFCFERDEADPESEQAEAAPAVTPSGNVIPFRRRAAVASGPIRETSR